MNHATYNVRTVCGAIALLAATFVTETSAQALRAAAPSDIRPSADCRPDGNPVSRLGAILATGEKIEREQDVVSRSEYGLGLKRTYRAYADAGASFGAKWYSEYDYAPLVTTSTYEDLVYGTMPLSVVVSLPDGSRATYTRGSGGTYTVFNSAAMGSMTYNPVSPWPWSLVKDKLTYVYSSAGIIQRIENAGGLALLTFGYAPSQTGSPSRPASVTNAVGQAMTFSWSNGRIVQVVDPSGGIWGYGYNANGMLLTVTSPGNVPGVRTYYYGNPSDSSLITGIMSGGVRYSTYSYQSDKRIKTVTLAGNEQSESYAYAANQTTLTNAAGKATVYGFAAVTGGSKLVSVAGDFGAACNGESAQTVYDANGNPDYTVDGNGNVADYSYGAAGRLLQVVAAWSTPVASKQVNTWSGENLLTTTYRDAADVAYRKIVYAYNASGVATGRLASATTTNLRTGEQQIEGYGYSFFANKTLASSAVVRTLAGISATTLSVVYDALGNPTQATNALGHVKNWSLYNGAGQAGQFADANNLVHAYVYDANGNLLSSARQVPGGARVTAWTYDADRRVTDAARPDGRVDRWRYNGAGRVVSTGNAQYEFVNHAYDVSSNTLLSTSARNVPMLSGLLPIGLASLPFSVQRSFDTLGRPVVGPDENGVSTTRTFDVQGNLLSTQSAAAGLTTYTYDAQNRVVTVTAPGGVTTYAYADGRLALMSSPGNATRAYAYDVRDRIVLETEGTGEVTSYTWDALDRITARASGGQVETYTYDEGSTGKGRLTRIANPTRQTSYLYSTAGDLVRQITVLAGQSYTTTWNFDTQGRLTSMGYADGLTVNYARDGFGRVASVSSNLGGVTATLADTFLYEPATDRGYAWRNANGAAHLLTLETSGTVLGQSLLTTGMAATPANRIDGPNGQPLYTVGVNLQRLLQVDECTVIGSMEGGLYTPELDSIINKSAYECQVRDGIWRNIEPDQPGKKQLEAFKMMVDNFEFLDKCSKNPGSDPRCPHEPADNPSWLEKNAPGLNRFFNAFAWARPNCERVVHCY